MKKALALIIVSLFMLAVQAQTADFVTEMIDTKSAANGQLCYMSAVYQGFIADTDSYQAAVTALYKAGQIPYLLDKDGPVYYINAAFVFSELWHISGGLMFRITGGSPRYAFRQMKADGVIPQDADPRKKLSGQELMNLYTDCVRKYGEEGAVK